MINKADIVVYVYDLVCGLLEEDQTALNNLDNMPVVLVGNKADLVPKGKRIGLQLAAIDGPKAVEPLVRALLEQATKSYGNADASRTVINARHKTHLKSAHQALLGARTSLNANQPPDIFSLDLRAAARELGMITGVITNETVLGTIFSRFCIGK